MKEVSVQENKEDESFILMANKPYFSVIWLHGLGDSSQGFLDFFQHKQSPLFNGGRIKLLNAPLRSVTINGGGISTSWYDIKSLSPDCKAEDKFSSDEVKESLQIIDGHVASEIHYWKSKGIQGSDEQISKRIFIGGFSQGCAMSLCYGLTSTRLLGGVIGYSGHLFEGFDFKNRDKIPMLVYHGDQDNILNYKWVKPGYDKYLRELPNFQFILISKLAHSVTIEQLVKANSWILQKLQKSSIRE